LTQFPEFRTGIDHHPHPHVSCCGQRLVHRMCMRFRELSQSGIGRNSREFLGTPFDSAQFRLIPEFRESVLIPFDSEIAFDSV
jgi:hypothetical protein